MSLAVLGSRYRGIKATAEAPNGRNRRQVPSPTAGHPKKPRRRQSEYSAGKFWKNNQSTFDKAQNRSTLNRMRPRPKNYNSRRIMGTIDSSAQ